MRPTHLPLKDIPGFGCEGKLVKFLLDDLSYLIVILTNINKLMIRLMSGAC